MHRLGFSSLFNNFPILSTQHNNTTRNENRSKLFNKYDNTVHVISNVYTSTTSILMFNFGQHDNNIRTD